MTKQNVERQNMSLTTTKDVAEPNWLSEKMDQKLLSAVLETSGALIAVVDCEGRYVHFNRACEETSGYSFAEVAGRHFWEILLLPEEIENARGIFEQLKAGQFPNSYENYWLTKNKQLRRIAWSNTAIVNDHGVDWVVGTGIDITDYFQAQKAREDSDAQLAGIISSAMDAIITIDADQKITLFNTAAERMFDCSAEDALGSPIDRFIPPRFRKSHQEHVESFGRTHVTRRSMGTLGYIFGLRTDGTEFPIEASISQIDVNGRKLFTVILRDTTKRLETEEQLKEQAAMLDHAQDAIMVRDLNENIIFWNKGAQRVYGWTAAEAIGRNITRLIYKEASLPQFVEAKQKLLELGEWMGELNQVAKDGTEIITESRWTLVRDEAGNPKSILVINTDITGRKRIEAQFLRAQRMESIGTLAGGIAHDLNNVLSPILMALRMFQLKFTDTESQNLLATVQASAERGAGLVNQVLSFARGVEGERIALQPKHLIKEVIKILGDTLPKSIDIKFGISNDLWPIAGDPTQLHQVLMNLCVNARDAMPMGGRLTIEAENVVIDQNYARMNIDAKTGRFVQISIWDTGVGISPDNIDRIFEPFFTTKDQTKGTGLGLSTVLTIVKSHGGFVNVYSEPDKGSQFRIYLPALEMASFAAAIHEADDLPLGHGETILIVDDEAGIREITKATLEAHGYHALTAADGTEAIALFAEHKQEVDVVLMDMMMPYLDGPAAIRALQKLDPHVKVIATSGLKATGQAMEGAGSSVKMFLGKPYTADKLLNAISRVLAGD